VGDSKKGGILRNCIYASMRHLQRAHPGFRIRLQISRIRVADEQERRLGIHPIALSFSRFLSYVNSHPSLLD